MSPFPNNGQTVDVSTQVDKERYGIVVLGLPKTRTDAVLSKVILKGDVNEASKYVPLVPQQMMQMHQQNVNNLEIVNRPVDLGNGNYIDCSRNFSHDMATVFVKPTENVTEVVTVTEEGS